MINLLLLIIWVFINLISAQQFYDSTECSVYSSHPGSRYICSTNSSQDSSCAAFLVYRANKDFPTLAQISALFNKQADDGDDEEELLLLNSLSSASQALTPGREILIPTTCSCSDKYYFNSHSSFTVSETKSSFLDIACGVFEGLLNLRTLVSANYQLEKSGVHVGAWLDVPLKCACPDNFTRGLGIRHLVTYPILEGDNTILVSQKFGVSADDIWSVNSLDPKKPTVYPGTTLLVPLKRHPTLNLTVQVSHPPSPHFLPTTAAVDKSSIKKLRRLYIAGSITGFILLLIALGSWGLYAKALRKWNHEKLQSFNQRGSSISCSPARSSTRSPRTERSSSISCLSPDLLVGIKSFMCYYTVDDLMIATEDFSEETKISEHGFKGKIGDLEVVIKQMKLEEAQRVIDVHSRIHHINIAHPRGVCYGENKDLSLSYVVFEYPKNGCLRNKLSDSLQPLSWQRRTQIAFDIATGLHYLHNCIFPSYVHMCINSRNIFLTANWRAKLAIIAPDYNASEKADIFAFGFVLLELISGRDGGGFKDTIDGFLGGVVGEGGCFDQLRSFADPSLKQDYPLAEALCLAVLAKACVEDDPLHRPAIDDVMKVLARMV